VMEELGAEGDVGGVVKRCVGATVAGGSAGAAAEGLPEVETEGVNVGAGVTEVEAVGGRDGASVSPGAVGARVLGERWDGGVLDDCVDGDCVGKRLGVSEDGGKTAVVGTAVVRIAVGSGG
jgi:hypothetical protein